MHIYRELRLYFPGIEASSPEEASTLAGDKPTGDAEYTEDCDGENLSALIDLVGDDGFEKSVTIDFEPERLRKIATELLDALRAASDWIDAQIFAPRNEIQATVRAAIAKAAAVKSDRRPV